MSSFTLTVTHALWCPLSDQFMLHSTCKDIFWSMSKGEKKKQPLGGGLFCTRTSGCANKQQDVLLGLLGRPRLSDLKQKRYVLKDSRISSKKILKGREHQNQVMLLLHSCMRKKIPIPFYRTTSQRSGWTTTVKMIEVLQIISLLA